MEIALVRMACSSLKYLFKFFLDADSGLFIASDCGLETFRSCYLPKNPKDQQLLNKDPESLPLIIFPRETA